MSNSTIINRMKQDFDAMLHSHIPGQNHDCDLIHSFGFDGGMTAYSEDTRCVCYADAKEQRPVFRTSLDYPIHQGMLVSLKNELGFYLLEEHVSQSPSCYQTKATPCNAQITISVNIPAVTDTQGYLIQEEQTQVLIRNMPCVVRSNPTLANGDAGLIINEDTRVSLQLNKYTQNIPTEAYFALDGQMYTIYAKKINADINRVHGIVELTCRRIVGGELKR